MSQIYSEADDISLLRCALAVHDDEARLWPPESIELAKTWFRRTRGEVPSLERVFQEIGHQRAEQMTQQILDDRNFKNYLLGYGKPCHYCGAEKNLIFWNFALMKVEDSHVSIGGTVASAAISAITLPLLGAGAIRFPGRMHSGQAFRLRLVTCRPCCKKHGNIFGLFILNKERASAHPLWNVLFENGFTKFFTEERMPEEVKHKMGDYL